MYWLTNWNQADKITTISRLHRSGTLGCVNFKFGQIKCQIRQMEWDGLERGQKDDTASDSEPSLISAVERFIRLVYIGRSTHVV